MPRRAKATNDVDVLRPEQGGGADRVQLPERQGHEHGAGDHDISGPGNPGGSFPEAIAPGHVCPKQQHDLQADQYMEVRCHARERSRLPTPTARRIVESKYGWNDGECVRNGNGCRDWIAAEVP